MEWSHEGGIRRKKISITELESLKMTCAEKFNIMVPFRLEQWDVTCCREGVWIEVDDLGDLENGSKLRIVPSAVQNCSSPPASAALPSGVSAEPKEAFVGSDGDSLQSVVP